MYAMKLAGKTQRLGSSLVRWLALFRLSPLGLPYVRLALGIERKNARH